MTPMWIAILGGVAGFLTTVAYVPQVIKIWRQGGRDLSYGMLALYIAGVLLWIGYGLAVHAKAVVLTNVATAILMFLTTALKAWKERSANEERPRIERTGVAALNEQVVSAE